MPHGGLQPMYLIDHAQKAALGGGRVHRYSMGLQTQKWARLACRREVKNQGSNRLGPWATAHWPFPTPVPSSFKLAVCMSDNLICVNLPFQHILLTELLPFCPSRAKMAGESSTPASPVQAGSPLPAQSRVTEPTTSHAPLEVDVSSWSSPSEGIPSS